MCMCLRVCVYVPAGHWTPLQILETDWMPPILLPVAPRFSAWNGFLSHHLLKTQLHTSLMPSEGMLHFLMLRLWKTLINSLASIVEFQCLTDGECCCIYLEILKYPTAGPVNSLSIPRCHGTQAWNPEFKLLIECQCKS